MLTLGTEKELRFKTPEEKTGQLLIETKEGPQVIAIRAGETLAADGEKALPINGWEKLSPAQLKNLRGVELGTWSKDLSEKLNACDLPHLTLMLQLDRVNEAPNIESLPELPEGLAGLFLTTGNDGALTEIKSLANLKSLRFLLIRAQIAEWDAGILKEMKELRHLDISGQLAGNLATLGALKNLRVLHLDYERLADLGFAKELPDLRELTCSGSQVADVQALGGHPHLEHLDLNRCPIQKLPEQVLPALRKLEFVGSSVPEEEAARFAKAHPQCTLVNTWRTALLSAAQGVTRIRVRTGGVCHRAPIAEKSIVELKTPEEIAQFFGMLELNEAKSGQQCPCCGGPTFECFVGNEMKLVLVYHHGQLLRWANGPWPGDAAITEACGKALAAWLSKQGFDDATKEFQKRERDGRAARHRFERYKELIPKDVWADLETAQSEEAAIAAFESHIPDAVKRAELYLKMFGCDDNPWDCAAMFDEALADKLLPRIEKAPLSQAAKNVLADRDGLNGLARWTIFRGRRDTLDAETMKAVYSVALKRALMHPHDHARRIVIQNLDGGYDKDAIPLLREAFNGTLKPDAVPADQGTIQGATTTFLPYDPLMELDKLSERTLLAVALYRLGDEQSLPEVKKLAVAATGRDAEILGKLLQEKFGEAYVSPEDKEAAAKEKQTAPKP